MRVINYGFITASPLMGLTRITEAPGGIDMIYQPYSDANLIMMHVKGCALGGTKGIFFRI